MNNLIQRIRRRALSEYNTRLHGSSVPFVHVRPDAITPESWVDSPIHPPDILEGTPQAATFTYATSGDGGMSVGLWRCRPQGVSSGTSTATRWCASSRVKCA